MPRMCGDSQCPSCGLAQSTLDPENWTRDIDPKFVNDVESYIVENGLPFGCADELDRDQLPR